MRVPQKMVRIDLMVPQEAEEGGTVAPPIRHPQAAGAGLVQARGRAKYAVIARLM